MPCGKLTAPPPRLLARPWGRRRSIASRSARLYGCSLRSQAPPPRLLARPWGRRRSIASRSARLYGCSLRSQALRHELRQIEQALRVAHLVVVPAQHLAHVADDRGQRGVDRRRMAIAVEVDRHERLVDDRENAVERTVGGGAHRVVDVVDARLLLE